MRFLLALLALFTLSMVAVPASTVSAAPPRDWSTTATVTPGGAFVLGNPKAKVRLVEYASYTCPHCAHFYAEASPALKAMIRSGSTAWEFRHLIRDRLDLAAAILARCTGTKGFFGASEAIFAAQDRWMEQGIRYEQLNGSQIRLYGQPDQLRAVAEGSGLTALVQARGLGPQAAAACFDDEAALARITAMTAATPASVTGTPTFFINGRIVPQAASWAALRPALRAAGAR